MGKRRFSGEAVPDDLRCRRTDGRRWRCPMRAMLSITFCEHHYLQSRRNMEKKLKVHSESAKISRCRRRRRQRDEERSDPAPPPPKEKWWRRWKGDPPTEELIEMALSWQMERREEREKRRREAEAESEVTRDLPNGVMAISPAPARVPGNAGPPLDQKIGFDAGCFLRRCFRSKNAERVRVPVGSIQRFCRGRVLEKDGKRICQGFGECKDRKSYMKDFFGTNCGKECYKTCM